MAINIRRFDPSTATPVHEGTILGSNILPDTMKAPFGHHYGYFKESGSVMAGHSHPTDEIYIVLSGTGHMVIGSKTKFVTPGDVIAIPAGEWHTIMCTEKDDAPFLWAAFWWDAIESVPKDVLNEIHTRRFIKEKAYLDHQDTILADKVLPTIIKAPFDHAMGYLENGNEMELHAHPAEEFYIVYSGNGFVTVGDEQCAVSAGDVIEIPSNVMHTMTATDDGELLWAAIWWDPI